VVGVVLERRLELIAHGGLEVVLARANDATTSGQFGQLPGVGENVNVNATGAAQLKTPAQRASEGAQDGSFPAAHVGTVE
jgi:hypothetical protein